MVIRASSGIGLRCFRLAILLKTVIASFSLISCAMGYSLRVARDSVTSSRPEVDLVRRHTRIIIWLAIAILISIVRPIPRLIILILLVSAVLQPTSVRRHLGQIGRFGGDGGADRNHKNLGRLMTL